MKLIFMKLIVILCAALIFSSCSQSNNQSNFNGDFETKSFYNDTPADWYPTIIQRTKDFVVYGWDDKIKHSGDHSVSIKIIQNHPEDKIAYNWMTSFKDFKINQKYTLTGWTKTENLKSTPFFYIQCLDENNSITGFFTTEKSYHLVGTHDWSQVKLDFTIPDKTNEVLVRLGITAPENNGGQVWFDDIEIE